MASRATPRADAVCRHILLSAGMSDAAAEVKAEKKEEEVYKPFDPTSIGLDPSFRLTNYTRLKG